MCEMFLTVMAGLIIFIISQLILKFTLEPVRDLKNVMEEIRRFELYYRDLVTLRGKWGEDVNDFKVLGNECKQLSTRLISAYHSVLFYNKIKWFFNLPTIKKLERSSYLLFLSYWSCNEGTIELKKEGISKSFKEIREELNFPEELLEDDSGNMVQED